MGSQLGLINQSFIREALDELPNNFTITDPYVSGHPIVFASKGFLKMCGYDENDVIGRNGRIFQGPLTDRKSVMEIREAIREERSVQVNLLNYRKDGTQFWMLFHLSPVFSKVNGRVTHFVSVQVPIPRRKKGSLCNHVSKLQEMVLGSCRREVCGDTYVESSCIRTFDSFVSLDNRGLEPEESCEASDLERRQALTAINLILSLLTHYSEPFGRVACGKRCCSAEMGRLDSSLSISLGRIKQSFVLTDPHLHDMPIVYASDAFLHLTGYTKHEVLGCNWRFLNGPDTDVIAVNKVDLYHWL
ncbi:hypothetical protein GIB67_033016 [Kingdonia uniflora]|uniref:PAS domain-containing protein n=1 Tax=Kingdonia uniflora TaxID=39325 RepID=A0A7J7MYT6_9MAGN|nr:hypothetical protein GIB67_033016 [Kingdonia uniflora]